MSTQLREIAPSVAVAVALMWIAWLLGVAMLFNHPASPEGPISYLAAHIEGALVLLVLASAIFAFGAGHNWGRLTLLAFVGLVLLSWLASAITGYNILFGYGWLSRSATALATISLAISFTGVAARWFNHGARAKNAA